MNHKVYLAGAIAGLSYEGATDWREFAQRQLALKSIDGYSPMRSKKFLKGTPVLDTSVDNDHPLTSVTGIVTRDRFDVMTCDVLLVNLLGTERVSIGTMFEMAWADAFRKPIVLVIEAENIHQHPFLQATAGFIVPTLEEALEVVIAILKP